MYGDNKEWHYKDTLNMNESLPDAVNNIPYADMKITLFVAIRHRLID